MEIEKTQIKIPVLEIQDIIQRQYQSSQSKLIIKKPKSIDEGIKLVNQAIGILSPSFVMLILGKPGSGKSHLLSQLITQDNFFGNKFNRVIYIGPSKYQGVVHDKFNTSPQLDIQWIIQHIKSGQNWCRNMLIVMDDVISSFPTTSKSRLQQLFFNRRHELKNGCISIILTSQKYTTVPTWIRNTINNMITFAISQAQLKSIYNELCFKVSKQRMVCYFKNLRKHSFLFHNLQSGDSFNDLFIKI